MQRLIFSLTNLVLQSIGHLYAYLAQRVASSLVQWTSGTAVTCNFARKFAAYGFLANFPTDLSAAVTDVCVFAAHLWNLKLQVAANPSQIADNTLAFKPNSRDVCVSNFTEVASQIVLPLMSVFLHFPMPI